MQKTLKVEGMNCMHCAGKVGAALEMIDGISKADVSLEAGTAVVDMDREIPEAEMATAVSEVGYTVVQG